MSCPVTDTSAENSGAVQNREAIRPGGGISFRARALIIGPIVLSVFLLGAWFVGSTWRRYWDSSSLAFPITLALLTASFVPSTFISFRYGHPLVRALNAASAIALGFLSSGVIAAGLCRLALGTAPLFGWSPDPRLVAATLYGAAALLTIYGIANAAWLRTTHVKVRLRGLPPAWNNARIALVSDIHLGNIRGRRFVRRIAARLRELKPDAVLIAGDMFDGTQVDLDRVTQPWSTLSVADGIYFVTGNHDEFSDRARYLRALERVGIRVLNNEKVDLRGLQIVGVLDGEAGDPRLFGEILREANLDRTRASILLTHQPNALSIPEGAGITLQLSGHTHSGQFWPWHLLVRRVYGRFAYGLNQFGKMLVYTSSGAGTWGPPLRIGTRPEIVLLQLEQAD
jgi:predicted MPP superfamily phosphohydrolase